MSSNAEVSTKRWIAGAPVFWGDPDGRYLAGGWKVSVHIGHVDNEIDVHGFCFGERFDKTGAASASYMQAADLLHIGDLIDFTENGVGLAKEDCG